MLLQSRQMQRQGRVLQIAKCSLDTWQVQCFQQLSLPKVKQTIDMLSGIWHGEVFIALKIFFARWNFNIGFVQSTLFCKPWYPKGREMRKGKSYVLMLSCFQTITCSK